MTGGARAFAAAALSFPACIIGSPATTTTPVRQAEELRRQLPLFHPNVRPSNPIARPLALAFSYISPKPHTKTFPEPPRTPGPVHAKHPPPRAIHGPPIGLVGLVSEKSHF